MENPRALRHLHHEGALPARQIVRRADAREQPIDEADARALRGNERSRLRQHDDESHLPHGGALPRHVGPGEHHQAAFRVERQIVRNERPFPRCRQRALDDRVSSLHNVDDVGIVDDRPHPTRLRGNPREREQRISLGHGGSARAQFGAARQHRGAQLLEDLLLDGRPPLVGGQNTRFVIGERWSDEAFGTHGGRAALISRWDEVQVRLRDFDVEARDPVVPDLQRLDSRPRPLLCFERGDGRASSLGQIGQLVQLGPETGSHESRLAARWNFVAERTLQQRGELPQSGERRRELTKPLRRARRQLRAEIRPGQ